MQSFNSIQAGRVVAEDITTQRLTVKDGTIAQLTRRIADVERQLDDLKSLRGRIDDACAAAARAERAEHTLAGAVRTLPQASALVPVTAGTVTPVHAPWRGTWSLVGKMAVRYPNAPPIVDVQVTVRFEVGGVTYATTYPLQGVRMGGSQLVWHVPVTALGPWDGATERVILRTQAPADVHCELDAFLHIVEAPTR